MHQDYIDYELIRGGPKDGHKGHLYTPTPEIRFICNQDVFYAAAGMPTSTELFHVYRLSHGNATKIFYKYEGYSA